MVADLLRAVAPEIAGRLDLATLRDVSAQYVGERHQQRRGDKVWRAALRELPVDVLALLEFQSDKAGGVMPLRTLEYTALLFTELHRQRALGPPGAWPLPLPVVLYNGVSPWTAPVEMGELFAPAHAVLGDALRPYAPSQRVLLVDELRTSADDMPPGNLTRAVLGFEQGRSPADLVPVAEALTRWLGPGDAELRRVFVDWLREMDAGMRPPGAPPARAIRTLEDASMSLVERIGEWHKPWVEQGVVRGLERGLEQGLASERALLARLASSRFGGAAAGAGSRRAGGYFGPGAARGRGRVDRDLRDGRGASGAPCGAEGTLVDAPAKNSHAGFRRRDALVVGGRFRVAGPRQGAVVRVPRMILVG